MKLKFNPNLDYQQDAIAAVVDLFEGMPAAPSDFEVSFSAMVGSLGMTQTELGIGNALLLDDDVLLQNVRRVQERNQIELSQALIGKNDAYDFFNFSVEMETGTGKTYVYLRTIFELNQRYGLKKFIIVVPSVAVREGVTASIRGMREHFRSLYNNTPFDYFVYQSKDLSKVRQFATANTVQIMVINIQAFQKDASDEGESRSLNIIHQEQDRMSGRRPIEFIQASRPVVIIDEPQSVDNTEKAKRAIKTLRPLLALRYSATLNNPYNLIYQLGPIKAYDLRLVKQIEVASITADRNINETFLRLDHIGYQGAAKTPTAKVTIFEDAPNGTREKSVKLKQALDLSDHTNRPGYEGYIVDEIYAEPGAEYVRFANGVILEPAEEMGGLNDDIMRMQIRQTVEEHFKKERNFQKQGKAVKVLSLLFIDRVDNYRAYDSEGNPAKGKLALWFEEAYQELAASPLFSTLPKRDPASVHDGYFSVDKKQGKVVGLKDTKGNTAADEETYVLIMRDKERLLSEDQPLRFIFSHSALKEGWDNPNVFQICSLRELGSDRERRQTLGRGLRLPVDANGERIYDEAINKLTVIASESFEDYAQGLQTEIEKDIGGGFRFGRVPKIAFARLSLDGEQAIGQQPSAELWQALVMAGYLTEQGDITDVFTPQEKGFVLQVPEVFEPVRTAISDEMQRYLFKGRVVNAREKAALRYDKRVELNDEFKILWDKIKHKTRYRVEFNTDTLIARAVDRIREMPAIKPLALTIDKTEVDITDAGVEAGRQIQIPRSRYITPHNLLPDILSFLQRETELTRGTLVKILKTCGRLGEFKLNPQAFMTQVARQLNKALQELIVDGIKYEKLAGRAYEMSLFDQPELESYLSRLYTVQYSIDGDMARTPYNYIEYESEIEKEVAQKLDEAENVRFFCKLPGWFKVKTPLGDYNPDWAVVLEEDSKLYLVRETKSTHESDQRRMLENLKIKCGAAHFQELDVNFKVAASVAEVIQE